MTTPNRRAASTASIPAATGGIIVAILLVAANLRATLTGVGVLLPDIQRDTGLSSLWGGVLTTLPLLTFAVTSPFVGRASHRLGTARLMVLSLLVLAVGTVLRSLPSAWCLFAGTVVLSAAIAVGNVLLPAVVRRYLPARQIPTVSSLYVSAMALIAGVSSGISVPLANLLPGGWRSALAWGVVITLVALIAWLPRLRTDPAAPTSQDGASSTTPTEAPARIPWRSALAWQVSAFMGLQSLVFYTVIAWLPSILVGTGMSAGDAGWMLFLFQVVGLAASLVLPVATRGRADQRYTAFTGSLLVAAGFLVLLVPGLAVLACALLGLGAGAVLVLAMSFQSQRAAHHSHAVALAGMAQTIGYLIAAAGPLAIGALHAATASWTYALLALAAVSSVMALAGLLAGRDAHVHPDAYKRAH